MADNDAEHARAYHLSFLAPEYVFSENSAVLREEADRLLVYSGRDGALHKCDGACAGSRTQGAITVMFPAGGDAWSILIDD